MAYLIIGGDQEKISLALEEIIQQEGGSIAPHPDCWELNQTPIKIEAVRQLQKFLAQKSWYAESKKTAIIWAAEALTPEAQNALLKTLEEPPTNSLIILIAQQKEPLLPTLVSRCFLKTLSSSFQDHSPQKEESIFSKPALKKLIFAEKISKNKEELRSWLEENIRQQQKILLEEPSPKRQHLLKRLLRAQKMLKANINPLWVVDWLLLVE